MSLSNLELLFNYSSCSSFCQAIPSFLFYIFLHSSRMNLRQLFYFSYTSCQLNLSLTIPSSQPTLYLTCQLNYPTQKALDMFPYNTTDKKSESQNNFSKLFQLPKIPRFLHFSTILFLHP